jgi:rhomboid protease GluP
MNMLGLLHLSRVAEPLVGSVRLLIVYVASGLAGFAVSLAWSLYVSEGGAVTGGASGAVFGLLGLLLGFSLRRNDPQWKRRMIEMTIFAVAIGFAVPAINNAAHLGGLGVGVAGGLLFAPGAPKPSRPWHRLVAAAAMLACLGSIAATRLSPLYEPMRKVIERDRLEQRYD